MTKRITYQDMVAKIRPCITEYFPWDVEEKLEAGEEFFILDVRETHEFDTMSIKDSLNVPRGILETAVEWDHEETDPDLVLARDKQVLVVCRWGSRSVFATYNLQQMGYENVASLKTGLRGWSEYELPLYDLGGEEIELDIADRYFANKLLDFQRKPKD